jgi:hypothetical protein
VCVLNRNSGPNQVTLGVYVDDIIITSKSATAVKDTIAAIKDKYLQLKIHEGATHNYLGMVLTFTTTGAVHISQQGMIEEISKTPGLTELAALYGTSDSAPNTPAAEHLFTSSNLPAVPSQAHIKLIHSVTAKILFVANRGRPDLLTFISYMTKKVLNPTAEDARKLLRAIAYLKSTAALDLRLSYTGVPKVHTYIDASSATHPNRRSHTGVYVTLGQGGMYTKSTMQKINTTSSCESEIVALAKGMQQSLWARNFLAQQGFPSLPVQVYQDNQAAIQLIERGRPAAEQTRHIEIGYFWVADLALRGHIVIEFCPTLAMIADFFTKPLQGALFTKLRACVLGHSDRPSTIPM